MTGDQPRQFRFHVARAVRDHPWLALAFGVANLILVARALRFVWNRVGLAEAAPTSRLSLSDMEKQVRSQGTSESMWPVRSLGFREQRVPGAAEDAARLGSESVDVDGGGTPPAVSQEARTTSELTTPQEMQRDASVEMKEQGAAKGTESAEAQAADPAAKFAPPRLPDWFWDGAPAGTSEVVKPAGSETSETAETLPDVASRLSALRGAVSGLRGREQGTSRSRDQETKGTRLQEGQRELLGEIDTAAAVQEKPVAAEPRIAAPREFIPVKKRDAGDEWDEGDVRILPARRGQYKP